MVAALRTDSTAWAITLAPYAKRRAEIG